MGRLAEQHDARLVDPFEQRPEIDRVDRAEWLGRVSNAFDQLFVTACDCRRRAANAE